MTTIRLDEATPAGQVHLGEASGGNRRRLLIISPGWGSSGYYPAEVLERDAPTAFPQGTHLFVDHPGDFDSVDRARVGRSVRDLAAVLETDGRWDPHGPEGPGVYAIARITEQYAPLIDDLAEHIGVSVRGTGLAETGEAEGRTGRIVTRLHTCESVDFVTRAGRGGRVLELVESLRTVEALTANELRDAVTDAVRDQHGASDDVHLYVVDYSTDDGWVVFERWADGDESYHRTDLQVDGDQVTVGADAVEVERQVTYVAADAVTEALTEARAAVEEARNVGQWHESHIHLDFTQRADLAAADGRLTRDERIALSGAIGAALQAFTEDLMANAPHLYDRDPYAEPDPEIPPTTTRTEESTMTEQEMNERIAAVEARLATVESERDEAAAERDRLRDAERLRTEQATVTEAVAAIEIPQGLETVAESIRTRAARGITVPRDSHGQVDTTALAEAARTAVAAEVEYLAQAPGARVVGLGEAGNGGNTPPNPDEVAVDELDASLNEAFAR